MCFQDYETMMRLSVRSKWGRTSLSHLKTFTPQLAPLKSMKSDSDTPPLPSSTINLYYSTPSPQQAPFPASSTGPTNWSQLLLKASTLRRAIFRSEFVGDFTLMAGTSNFRSMGPRLPMAIDMRLILHVIMKRLRSEIGEDSGREFTEISSRLNSHPFWTLLTKTLVTRVLSFSWIE